MLLLYGLRYEIQCSACRIAPNLTFRGKPNNVCGCDWQRVKQSLICGHRIYNHRGMLTSHLRGCSVRKAFAKGAIRLLITGRAAL